MYKGNRIMNLVCVCVLGSSGAEEEAVEMADAGLHELQ